ncbi:pentapeptide repeat-containing protein [Patescibacteria group bacterium]|nr:pentapeptide repeat-containing protein [Patescibacteria group bacterium]
MLEALIKGDSNEFNRLRMKYWHVREIDADGRMIKGQDLRYFNLIRLKISDGHFVDVTLGDTSLENMVFANCLFEKCGFERNCVSRLRLRYCTLRDSSFTGVRFSETQVSLTTFERVTFRGCNLSGIKDAHQAHWLDVQIDTESQRALLTMAITKGVKLISVRSQTSTSTRPKSKHHS